jgi:hypothetical protein
VFIVPRAAIVVGEVKERRSSSAHTGWAAVVQERSAHNWSGCSGEGMCRTGEKVPVLFVVFVVVMVVLVCSSSSNNGGSATNRPSSKECEDGDGKERLGREQVPLRERERERDRRVVKRATCSRREMDE